MTERCAAMVLMFLWQGCAAGGAQVENAPPSESDDRYMARENDEDVPYDFDARPEAFQGTASQQEKWWEAPEPCPEGSALYGGAPPEHDSVGCKTPQGKNEGRFTTFHPMGKKKEEGFYEDHFAEGVWTAWDELGQRLTETLYQGGKKHGLETVWYPDGVVKSQRPYVQGKRHGVVLIWDEHERKRTAVPYEAGKKHGPEARWDIDGDLARVIHWEHDLEVQGDTPD